MDHLFKPVPPNITGGYIISRAEVDAIESFAMIGLSVMFCREPIVDVGILWVVHGYDMDGAM